MLLSITYTANMEWEKKRKTRKQPNRKNYCFRWSLLPLVIFMKVFGMKLDDHSEEKRLPIKKIISCLNQIVGFAILVSNLYINFMSMKHDLQIKSELFINEDRIKFNLFGLQDGEIEMHAKFSFFYIEGPLFEHFVQVALVSGNHFFFFLALLLTDKWYNVYCLLIEIQQKLRLNNDFHRECRNRCLQAICLVIPSYICLYGVSDAYVISQWN